MTNLFHRISKRVSFWMGHPLAFAVAFLSIIFWALAGPLFGFSDTWQLTINTGTTIVTFLMVFLIQNTQNRDAQAVQLKLDELIRASTKARNELIDLENLSDAELEKLHMEFSRLKSDFAERAEQIVKHRKKRNHSSGKS